MKWIQWTDMHIGLPGQETRGVDVRANAKKIVAWLDELHFDQLVLTGDICYDFGRREVYEWLAALLHPWKEKIRAIPGNHDDPELLSEYFPSPVGDSSNSYFRENTADIDVLYLDSSEGLLPEEEWEWLEDQWADISDPCVVFMHHPPFRSGVPYMDESHAFIQPNRFHQLVASRDVHCQLFCGHYHLERTIQYQNLSVCISPTSYFHIDPSIREFKVDHYRLGLRSIEWTNGQLRTWVDYRDP